MKEWYYTVSDNPEEKYYFDSYEDTQFAILSVFRFRAPIMKCLIIMFIIMENYLRLS